MNIFKVAVSCIGFVAVACSSGNETTTDATVPATEEMPVEEKVVAIVESNAPIPLPPALVATEATERANREFATELKLDEASDFEDAKRGFIASIDSGVIKNEEGRVVWDLNRYAFLKGDAPSSVNPSLWRQAQLNNIHGLFKVVDRVYQVRGYDLSVMTVIEGDKGWILIDPLLTKETSAAALELVNQELGDRPVSAVFFTHSHGDHFGGIRGVASDEDISSGRVRIFAPDGFAETAVAENVLAGNAMTRRAQFQFGNKLKAGPVGQVDSGIGKALSSGAIGFMQPTDVVTQTGETHIVDGVEFIFVNAPDTEAPAEFMFYMPQFRALHTAELATGTMHNVLTLRGAKVRDALAWAKALNETIDLFAAKSDVVLASHNWPTWGTENVLTYLENQRDVYRWIHDQTIRLANQGYTMHEIADKIGEPEFMKQDFSVRGYYGTVNHNAKATYQRYFGWWDGNPANLNPHPPEEQASRMVELVGGGDKMLTNAANAFEEGDYRWVASVMNYLVFAEPDNERAKSYLAAAYEQLGFQSESSIWRNYYLTAALELREGVEVDGEVAIANADFVRAVPSGDYFDALASRVNPTKASNNFSINFSFSDTNEKFNIEIKDGVESQKAAGHNEDAPVSVIMDRQVLDQITLGQATFMDKLNDGSITVKGNPIKFGQFLLVHDPLDPFFNVVTP